MITRAEGIKLDNPDSQESEYPERRIALWAVPRSVSTAFLRVFMERDDTTAIKAPFTGYCYYSSNRINNRFSNIESDREHNFESCLTKVLNPCDTSLMFIKDIALHLHDQINHPFLADLTNTFITRHPYPTFISHYKVWQDFDFIEAGYLHQKRLFDHVVEDLGQKPVVVDGTTFRLHPYITMMEYCNSVNIPHKPESMHWERRPVFGDGIMDDGFFTNVNNSVEIEAPKEMDIGVLPRKYRKMADECVPYYEYLARYAIKPRNEQRLESVAS